MHLIITLSLCILISYAFSLIANKLKISPVVSMIVAGLVIGSSALNEIILGPNISYVLSIGDFGLLCLMLFAGMESSWSMLYKEKKESIIIAVFATFIPLLLGFFTFLLMGFPVSTSLIVGICMCITAEATKAKELLELKKLKTKIGSLLMGAGILDDLIGITLFIGSVYLFTNTLITKDILIVFGGLTAFFIGIFIQKITGPERYKIPYLENFLFFFIVPFFFISVGLYFNLIALTLNPFLLTVIIVTAIVGKILGVVFTRPFIKLRIKQLYLVGWGMNSRGAIELVIVFTAFKIGLLDPTLYSGLVVMALTTTFIFPFFIRSMVRKNPGIMD
ncbi:MAG: cation:proton antiporter [Candidatus Aenigmarchaeota archaeon]|nr:cation:proton antiporter [Candidatus Aenigmarchaeota archaeon]